MRWLALVLLVALPASAQDRFPRCRSAQGRSDRGFACADAEPFFSFAPASGAGLGAPCACAAVTGAKGETVTWTRGSSAMCTKSTSESSIANGDLVQCASNQPRVMSLGGPLGVLVESSRTNSTIRSQEFNDAAYVDSFSVVAAPTLNGADSAVAPDGTTTADAYTFPATTGAQHSSRAQAAGCPGAGAIVGSVYVKGQSGSGSLDVCANTTGCATCNYTNTSWTRCVAPSAGGTTAWYVGNMSAFNGSTARASNAVYLWGAQCEAGTYATSYIPTTTVAVTRSADQGLPPFTTPLPSGSIAVTTNLPGHTGDDGFLGVCGGTTTGINGMVGFGPAGSNRPYINNTDLSGSALTGGATGVTRRSVFWGTAAGYGLANTPGGTLSGATATTMTGTPAVLQLGDYNCGSPGTRTMSGILSRVCVDPDPNRCR